ncbi:helix-turn-helix domain-containing protein [Streptosporangium vulgare]|uniref:Helix-turn-helix domain-containing protein n=1 Tax=Streptosporangium vulgare TaxID=46190 RepID=A0ABV5TDA4_9ACTN
MGGLVGGEGRPELVRARRRMGMSQDAIAAALWVSATTWSRWERGRQEIRPVYRARMAEVFGVDPAEVERWIEGTAPVDTEAWLIPDFSDLSLGATVEAAGRLWRCDVDPERRHVLAALPFVPAALGGWLSEWSYGAPNASAAHQGAGAAVGLSDVRRIVEARQAFGEMDHRFGAGMIRPAVVDYLHSTVAPMLRGRYDDKVGAALMTAAAGMTLQAGWTAFDMGRHGQAQHYFGQALTLAKAGDDALTGAWVLTTMTIQAIYLGQPAWAVRLARAAVEAAHRGQAPPRVMAWLLSREAWATALQASMSDSGDSHATKRVEQLLGEVERVYAGGTTDRDPAWTAWFEPTEPVAEAGICWSLIGEHRRGADCAEAVLREYDQRRTRSAQLSRMSAAEAYLGMGELEQAVDSARATIPTARSLTSSRLVERIRKFSDRLEPYGTTVQVREFRSYLDSELASRE